MLAHSIRQWNPAARVAVMTLVPVQDPVFDHCVTVPYGDQGHGNQQANDWQVFRASPFRETIKLEADMLITSSIDHWWSLFRHRDLVISTGCRDIYDQPSACRHYRAVFDHNSLADVYNAVTYWRLSETARDFFRWVRTIFSQWTTYRQLLKFSDDVATTDVVYAMAAEILGRESVTMPFTHYPKIVHMKPQILGTHSHRWNHELVWEYHAPRLRINTAAQWGAVHYNIKSWRP